MKQLGISLSVRTLYLLNYAKGVYDVTEDINNFRRKSDGPKFQEMCKYSKGFLMFDRW